MLLADKTERFALNWCSLSPFCSVPRPQVRVALPLSRGSRRICAGFPFLLSLIYSFTVTSGHFVAKNGSQALSPSNPYAKSSHPCIKLCWRTFCIVYPKFIYHQISFSLPPSSSISIYNLFSFLRLFSVVYRF